MAGELDSLSLLLSSGEGSELLQFLFLLFGVKSNDPMGIRHDKNCPVIYGAPSVTSSLHDALPNPIVQARRQCEHPAVTQALCTTDGNLSQDESLIQKN